MGSPRYNTLLGVLRVVCVIYFAVIFAATHLPVPEALRYVVSVYDLFFHAAAYFVLGVLTILAFDGLPPLRKPSLPIVPALLLYAALDEYLQRFVNRTPDVRDWLADACGVLGAYFLIRWMAGRGARPENSQSNTDAP